MKKNKGFSLVELIIVIAIMAILVGVMAPQLLKYIEKAKVSSDVQTLDTIAAAYQTAVGDPDVVMASGVTVVGSHTVTTPVVSATGTALESAAASNIGVGKTISFKSSAGSGTLTVYIDSSSTVTAQSGSLSVIR